MSVSAGSAAVVAALVLAGWATVALCVSAVVAVLELRARLHGQGRAYRVSCPACGAPSRRPCRRLDGQQMASPHSVRAAVATGAIDIDEEARPDASSG